MMVLPIFGFIGSFAISNLMGSLRSETGYGPTTFPWVLFGLMGQSVLLYSTEYRAQTFLLVLFRVKRVIQVLRSYSIRVLRSTASRGFGLPYYGTVSLVLVQNHPEVLLVLFRVKTGNTGIFSPRVFRTSVLRC